MEVMVFQFWRQAWHTQERAKEQKRRADREALARGERLEDDGSNKPYGEVDEGLQGGIIIPLAPFGIPKYDNGERFDLKVRPLPFFQVLSRLVALEKGVCRGHCHCTLVTRLAGMFRCVVCVVIQFFV